MKLLIISMTVVFLFFSIVGAQASPNTKCKDTNEEDANLYWGDLHVHSGYSMDAYAFGTTANPKDAIAFAQGKQAILQDKQTRIKLKRPLDFVAITEHAETFDVMYICSDPTYSSLPYCQEMRDSSGTNADGSLHVFNEFLLPLVSGKEVVATKISKNSKVDKYPRAPICDEPNIDCDAASLGQWQRIQDYANEANRPCEFTAFIGYEWSATPSNQHWHRNIIFSGESVTKHAIDYLRFPTPEKMWSALDEQCRSENNCEVIAIPHNTNLSEGGGFDVETSEQSQLQQRAKYERLIEIHQSKGNSECLDDNWDDHHSDCGFEQLFPRGGREIASSDPDYVQKLDRSYARNVIGRGLIAYEKSGDQKLNPLQLGFIGSTDTHSATPGATEEDHWHGDAWAGGSKFKQRQLQRIDYNPGGLVAVWANANTRDSLFESLKERRAYATSGTRIRLNFSASDTGKESLCNTDPKPTRLIPMGGAFHKISKHDPSTHKSTDHQPQVKSPLFSIAVNMDTTPLTRIEIIKGTVMGGEVVEKIYPLVSNESGFSATCVNWTDPDYETTQATYWYARVFELATPRWSKILCEELNNCQQHPRADRMIQERAWSSPIWYLP